MGKRPKKEYVLANRAFLKQIAAEEDTIMLANGVMSKELATGNGGRTPEMNDVVSVMYSGKLINGFEFDSNIGNPYPEAFRLRDVVEGWQIALTMMHIGDKWRIYIPAEMGYGDAKQDDIPGGSTLIFEVELIGIH